jgi:hypothetical protein
VCFSIIVRLRLFLPFHVAALTRKLKSQRGSVSPCRSQSPNHLRPPSTHHINHSPSSGTVTLSPEFEPCGIATPSPWVENALDPNAVPSSKTTSQLGSPGMVSAQPGHQSDPLSGLIYSGWNPDLPEPSVLDH